MILKLVIVGVILGVGGFLLYPQIVKISDYPQIEAVAEDIGGLKDTTIKRANYEFDKTIDTVGNKIDKITPNADQLNPIDDIQGKIAIPQTREAYHGQVYEKNEDGSCKVSVPKMVKTINGIKEVTHTITLPECEYEKHKPVQVTVTTDPTTNAQVVTVNPVPQSQIFETLQLTTTRNDDNTVSIHYEDTSGKTQKVTVTLRNSEKELFSGEFFASRFDTSVNDVSASPHIIEMIVEHADYGTVASSVFNPQGSDEATIYGVFTK
ncbi:MAG: hypothetical protein ACREAX_00035 [Candidatus Nitrosotenuis sp.]